MIHASISNHHSDFFIRSRIHWAVQCWQGSSMAKEIPPWGVIGLQDDVNGKTPVTIFGDNQAAILITLSNLKDPVSHSKSKHMDIKFHWQREQVEKNEVRYEYVPSSKNIADILTKPLPNDQFVKLRNHVMFNKEDSAWRGVLKPYHWLHNLNPSEDANWIDNHFRQVPREVTPVVTPWVTPQEFGMTISLFMMTKETG